MAKVKDDHLLKFSFKAQGIELLTQNATSLLFCSTQKIWPFTFRPFFEVM